jgi:hypothetical protein
MVKQGAKRLTNASELRAIAHPLRSRLLVELLARKQGTATDLAQAVVEPVNMVSFHLRLLAKYGFIQEAPELARDGRDRWWRPMHEDGIDWDELAITQPQLVTDTHLRGMERGLQQILSYFKEAYNEPEWREGDFAHDWYMSLTLEERTAFDTEYLDLCFRWRDKIDEKLAAGDTEGRRSFAIFIYGFPLEQSAL